jgi:hypothetical protein
MHIEPIRLGLARDAPPDARQCLAPRFGNRLAALLTGEEALSLREPAPRPFDGAVDRRVDLILYGAILRPTDRHGRKIRQERTVSRDRRRRQIFHSGRSGSGAEDRAGGTDTPSTGTAKLFPTFTETPPNPQREPLSYCRARYGGRLPTTTAVVGY